MQGGDANDRVMLRQAGGGAVCRMISTFVYVLASLKKSILSVARATCKVGALRIRCDMAAGVVISTKVAKQCNFGCMLLRGTWFRREL